MTGNRIKEIALKHFANNGYEGASLGQIAEEVGIKKQSIYTHFKGKDELFLHVIRDVFVNELRFVINYLESHANQPIENCLHGFLLQYKERYEQNDSTKLCLRTSFFPPAHLYDQIMSDVYEYLDRLEAYLVPILDKAMGEGEISPVGAERAAIAFLGVLDGVFVEMLYGGPERLEKRIDASWYLYWQGLSKK
ncbi:TetR/AcrR family transcriptional regulator [Ammoniphilus sp. 3BR4]|uniref:TetR/AcrR family transcriptional regulator n=1 Tax=Ammoniphilus sp. 3BR4 TaxID=3158265 RepID=UPI0034667417